MIINRRTSLLGIGSAALWTTLAPGLALAEVETDQRFVFIFLRGGMDGLTIVPAYGDPDFMAARGALADEAPGAGSAFDSKKLDGFFALHRDLATMSSLFESGELAVMHAACHDYRDRSHFDGQDAFDRGSVDKGVRSGWLNRTLGALPTKYKSGRPDVAMGLGPTLPLSLRGEEVVGSWSPPSAPKAAPELLENLATLYGADPKLGPVLQKGLGVQNIGGSMASGMGGSKGFGNAIQFQEYAKAAATFLNAPTGPRIVTIDYGNWDSHANQNTRVIRGSGNGNFAGLFSEMYLGLDRGIAALKAGIKPDIWRKTVVLLVTEFGRTVRINGTNGTDHGTGGAAFLLGGAVKGGRVIADWPGLKEANLLDGRDLKPTLDLRGVVKGVLREHLGVSEAALETSVFPNTASVKAIEGLFRT